MTKTRRTAAWWQCHLARSPLVAPGGVKGRWSGDLAKETGRSRSPEDQSRARLVWRGFLGATGLKVAVMGTVEFPEDWWGSGLGEGGELRFEIEMRALSLSGFLFVFLVASLLR